MSDHCEILWVIRHNRCLDLGNDWNKFGNHCSRSTLLKVYFGCLIQFTHFIIMVGGTPSLASPDGTSLIFYYSKFWATCACPEKRVCPEIFHCIEIFFIFQDFWATCACPEKQSVPWIHFIEYILFIIQNFEQFALALKTEFALKFFTALKYFLSLRIFQQLALALKTEFALKFFTVLNYFYLSGFFSKLCLPWKQSLPWIFQAGGRQPPPASYATVVRSQFSLKKHAQGSIHFCQIAVRCLLTYICCHSFLHAALW